MLAPIMLLDLDGTLIDSQPGIAASCQAALRSLGSPASLTVRCVSRDRTAHGRRYASNFGTLR